MKYCLILLFNFLTIASYAQKCDRPKEVFIQLNLSNSTKTINSFSQPETFIYLEDSSEVFIRTTDIKEINEAKIADIDFQSVIELRQKEKEIMKCEVDKANGIIYVDTSINSIFQNIYMIIRDKDRFYKFGVRWIDGIE
ncbi:hypothetical protein [Marivirga sp.]|uniref:hypothetical protein n=1 Tax=Marivirga sp. TaxID=2018662 RepID=UPI003DA742F6